MKYSKDKKKTTIDPTKKRDMFKRGFTVKPLKLDIGCRNKSIQISRK